MASENKNENVMLTGQTAYFKKNGSMTNYGTLTIDNQEQVNAYGPGFIDVGSTLQPAELESSNDYVNTLASMEAYLADDFIAESDDYVVKANAENISSQLEERVAKINSYVNNMNNYNAIPRLKCDVIDGATAVLDLVIPIKLKPNFVLQIVSDLVRHVGTEYDIINSAGFRLWQSDTGGFFINDTPIQDLSHGKCNMEIIQHDDTFCIKINGIDIFKHSIYFNYEMDAMIDLRFATNIEMVKLYGDDGITSKLLPHINMKNGVYGIYDTSNSVWYPTETPIRLYNEYEYANIWNGALDLGYHPGPNTGLEVKYKQYSSISGSNYRNIVGCYSEYSVANTLSFGILVGSGATVYGCRNNNRTSWCNSGVVSANSDVSVVTLNKYGDGRLKSTGTMNFDIALSGTATITNDKGNTLWLGATNDLGNYLRLDNAQTYQIINKSDIYIYNIKIYEGTQLVRDYVVGTDLDGKKGMWDKIQCKLYPATKCSFSLRGNIIN